MPGGRRLFLPGATCGVEAAAGASLVAGAKAHSLSAQRHTCSDRVVILHARVVCWRPRQRVSNAHTAVWVVLQRSALQRSRAASDNRQAAASSRHEDVCLRVAATSMGPGLRSHLGEARARSCCTLDAIREHRHHTAPPQCHSSTGAAKGPRGGAAQCDQTQVDGQSK